MNRFARAALASTAASAIMVGVGLSSWHAFADPQPAGFQPPPDSAIPNDKFGEEVKLGETIFRDPAAHAKDFGGLICFLSIFHLMFYNIIHHS